MNSTPGTDQHDHKRHNHRLLAIAAGLAAVVIAGAGIFIFSGGGDSRGETRTVTSGPDQTAVTPGSETAPKVASFRRNSTPSSGTGGLSSDPATPTPTSTPAAKPTATPTPRPASNSSSSSSDANPGDNPGTLAKFDVLDRYKFTVHKEYTGQVGQDTLKSYQNVFSYYPGVVPDIKVSSDRAFTIDSAGTFVAPDRLSLVNNYGGGGKLYEWFVGRNWVDRYGNGDYHHGAFDNDVDHSSLSEEASTWTNGIWNWWNSDPDIQIRCHASSQQVNGQDVRECAPYQLTSDQVFNLIDVFGGKSINHYDTFNLQFWLMTDQNVPVRLRFNVAGLDANKASERIVANIDITQVNDSSLSVDFPKG
jgi:hypothetical protein